jgi:hypothetical protein
MDTLNPKDPRQIAAAALQLWDMLAEDSPDERALNTEVARGLIEQGLEKEEAATVAVLVKYALSSHIEGVELPAEIASLPIVKAALEELRGGGWSFE